MDNKIVAAQQAIEQILAGLDIKTVAYIDDVYDVENTDRSIELAIGWFNKAIADGKANDCSKLVEAPSFFDTHNDEIWKRRLRSHWREWSKEKIIVVLDGLAKIISIKVEIGNDQQSASLLRDLIPEEITLYELAPSDWESEQQAILERVEEKGLLCLFDHNLQGAYGYTDSSGIMLLAKMVDSRGNRPIICGLLSHTFEIDEEISRGEEFAEDHNLRRQDFLPLSKKRLRDPLLFAHGLKMMSLNYNRDFLTTRVKEIAKEANEQANDILMNIDVYNFDHMVLRSSEKEGVWEAETLFRLFETLRRVAFRKAAFTAENRVELNDKITKIRIIRQVETLPNEKECPPNQRQEIMRLELYEDAKFVNEAHLPLELGDIFETGGQKYILVAQPCDLVIRTSGNRKAQSVFLVRIEMHRSSQDPKFCFHLDYFDLDSRRKGWAKFRNAFHISPDVLDLAVFNSDGQCKYDPSATVPMLHTPWHNRLQEIKETFQRHREQIDEIYEHIPDLNDETQEYLKASLTHRLTASTLDISLDYENGIFEFGLRRIDRYRQPGALRLLNHFVAFLSRDAEEHDFAAD